MQADTPGDRFVALRHALDLTQDELATECGVGHATISSIEQLTDPREINRAKKQRKATLSKIAQALGLTRDTLVSYLVGDIDLDAIKNQQLRKIARPRLQFPDSNIVTPKGIANDSDEPSESVTRETSVHEPVEPSGHKAPSSPSAEVGNRSSDIHSAPVRDSHQSKNLNAIWVAPGVLLFLLLVGLGLIASKARWHGTERGTDRKKLTDITSQRPKKLKDLRQLHFIHAADRNTVWVTGLDGVIISTTNGFEDWKLQNSDTEFELQTVVFAPDRRTGWIVGEFGTILHTKDGGEHWVRKTSGVKESLRGLHFFDDWKRAWAVGNNGTILQTTDGGETWQPHVAEDIGYANTVYFRDDMHGWIGGQHGEILSTSDGGQTWQREQVSANERRIWSVFVDQRRGWAMAADGEVFMSSNGRQWQQFPKPLPRAHYYDVQFLDAENGWIVGENTILRTDDGGDSWHKEKIPGEVFLFSIHMIDEEIGWAVGSNQAGNAIILKHTIQGWESIE